jgi:hypothetical protein
MVEIWFEQGWHFQLTGKISLWVQAGKHCGSSPHISD